MVKPHGLFDKNLNAKQFKRTEKTITTSAYGQANLGMSSISNIIISVQTTSHIASLIVEDGAAYNYWVMVRKSDAAGTPVANTSLRLSIIYYTV